MSQQGRKRPTQELLQEKLRQNREQVRDLAPESIVGTLGTETTKIDVNMILPSPYQPRLTITDEVIAEKAEDIKINGQIQSIIVRRKPDNRYELIDGETRWRAMKLLGEPFIRAEIKKLTDQQAAIQAIAANTKRKGYTDYENALSLRRVEEEKLVSTNAETAALFGLQISDIYRLKAFFDLPLAAQQMLNEHPAMISRVAADKLKSTYLNYGELSEPHILLAMRQIGRGELATSNLDKWFESKLGLKPTKTKNLKAPIPKKEFKSESGQKLGEVIFDEKKSTYRVNFSSDELAKKFEEHINVFFKLISKTEDH